MHQFRNRTITNEVVTLDYVEFQNCKLTDCQIQYGGGPFAMTKSSLLGCTFHFVGPAKKTVELLNRLGILKIDPDNWRMRPIADEHDG